MLITPNYSAISVLHEGELRPVGEGKVWKENAADVIPKGNRSALEHSKRKQTDRLPLPLARSQPRRGDQPWLSTPQDGCGGEHWLGQWQDGGCKRGAGLQRCEQGQVTGQTARKRWQQQL